MTTELIAPRAQPDNSLLESGLPFPAVSPARAMTYTAKPGDQLATRSALSWSAYGRPTRQPAVGGFTVTREMRRLALTVTF